MRYTKILIVLLGVVFLAGCSSVLYKVNVDSICAFSSQDKKRYILLPGNKDGQVNDLQFQEFAAYTDKALYAQGFRKASNIDEAEIAILLCYGVSDPQFYEYTYSVPVWGQTGVSSSNSSGVINTFGNSTTYSGSTSYTPSYGVVGSSTHVGTEVIFARHLAMSGVDLEKFRKTRQIQDAQEIWSTKANSVGESGDLREIFPILLVASQKHIAENTGKKISYEIKKDKLLSQKLETLKQGNAE